MLDETDIESNWSDKQKGNDKIMLGQNRFVKVNVGAVNSIDGMTSTMTKVFNFLMCHMDSNNFVFISNYVKSRFLFCHGMEPGTYNNNIVKLGKAGLFESAGRSEYIINRKYAKK